MTNSDAMTPNQDDRVLAALSHVSVLMPMMGVIAPIVIWVTQKEKSKYVAFQALQALAFQFTMMLAWFIGMGCYMLSIFGIMFTIPFASTSQSPEVVGPIGVIFPFLVFGAIIIGGIVFVGYGVVGAVMAFQGKPFRYAVIGSRVEKFMQTQQD